MRLLLVAALLVLAQASYVEVEKTAMPAAPEVNHRVMATAYWSFDNAADPWAESNGNTGLDLTAAGTPVRSATGAVELEAGDTLTTASAALAFTEDMSFCYWVRFDGFFGFFHGFDRKNVWDGWEHWFQGTGQNYFRIGDGAAEHQAVCTMLSPLLDTWHHICGTLTDQVQIQCHVNGVAGAEVAPTGSVTDGGVPFVLGDIPGRGWYDEVYIWDYNIGPDGVKQMWSLGAPANPVGG